MLQNLAVVPLVLNIALPLIPLAILLFLYAWFRERRMIPKSQLNSLGSTSTVIVTSALLLGLSIITMFYLLTFILPLIVRDVPPWIARHLRKRKDKLRFGIDVGLRPLRPVARSFLLFLFAEAAVLALTNGLKANWLPNEIIQTKAEGAVSGQVFSSDARWTVFRGLDNRMHIVKTDEILSREPCYTDTSFLAKTPERLLYGHFQHAAEVSCSK